MAYSLDHSFPPFRRRAMRARPRTTSPRSPDSRRTTTRCVRALLDCVSPISTIKPECKGLGLERLSHLGAYLSTFQEGGKQEEDKKPCVKQTCKVRLYQPPPCKHSDVVHTGSTLDHPPAPYRVPGKGSTRSRRRSASSWKASHSLPPRSPSTRSSRSPGYDLGCLLLG